MESKNEPSENNNLFKHRKLASVQIITSINPYNEKPLIKWQQF